MFRRAAAEHAPEKRCRQKCLRHGSSWRLAWGLLIFSTALCGQQQPYGFGRPAPADDITGRNITVLPDGTGLPAGAGDAAKGRQIFEVRCVLCHGKNGEGKQGQYPALQGGLGSIGTAKPKKTVGSYWPYATTVWDFIHRAMPFNQPRSLTDDQVYSLTAYILFLNKIVGETEEMNAKTLPAVRMPNRNGFVAAKE